MRTLKLTNEEVETLLQGLGIASNTVFKAREDWVKTMGILKEPKVNEEGSRLWSLYCLIENLAEEIKEGGKDV